MEFVWMYMPMPSLHAIPALLGMLVCLLLGLMVVGFLRDRNHESGLASLRAPDGMLLAMLALATFAMGVFLTYMQLSMAAR
jgi:hypothetical protein